MYSHKHVMATFVVCGAIIGVTAGCSKLQSYLNAMDLRETHKPTDILRSSIRRVIADTPGLASYRVRWMFHGMQGLGSARSDHDVIVADLRDSDDLHGLEITLHRKQHSWNIVDRIPTYRGIRIHSGADPLIMDSILKATEEMRPINRSYLRHNGQQYGALKSLNRRFRIDSIYPNDGNFQIPEPIAKASSHVVRFSHPRISSTIEMYVKYTKAGTTITGIYGINIIQ